MAKNLTWFKLLCSSSWPNAADNELMWLKWLRCFFWNNSSLSQDCYECYTADSVIFVEFAVNGLKEALWHLHTIFSLGSGSIGTTSTPLMMFRTLLMFDYLTCFSLFFVFFQWNLQNSTFELLILVLLCTRWRICAGIPVWIISNIQSI